MRCFIVSRKKRFSSADKRIGERIKKVRTEAALNQTDFGKIFGIPQCDLSLIEKGERTISFEVLLSIANYFNISTDYFIKENGAKPSNPDLQFVCDYTGLSEKTVNILHTFKYSTFIDFCDFYVHRMCQWDIDNDETDKSEIAFNETEIGVIINDCCELAGKTKNTTMSTKGLFKLPEQSIISSKGQLTHRFLGSDVRRFNKDSLELFGKKFKITEEFSHSFDDFIEMRAMMTDK